MRTTIGFTQEVSLDGSLERYQSTTLKDDDDMMAENYLE